MQTLKRKAFLSNVIIVAVTLFLIIPPVITLVNSLFKDVTTLMPSAFTLSFYTDLFTRGNAIGPAIIRTLIVAFVPTVLMMLLMLVTQFVIRVYFPKVDKYVDILSKIPYGIQGVILAVSILSLYGGSDSFLSNRIFLVICAYGIVILPYMYQGIKNALNTIDVVPILESAAILGANKFYTYFRIIVPSVKKGLLATLLLAVGILFGDFVLINILAGSYFPTLGVYLNEIRAVSGHSASAVSVLMFTVMLLLSYGVTRLNRKA